MVFMTNIPRRKIYETMLEFEEGLIDLQILIFDKKNYDKFSENFNKHKLKKTQEYYREIKALLILFLENKKHGLGEGFEEEFSELLSDEKRVNRELHKNPNIPENLKENLKKVDTEFLTLEKLASFEESKKVYDILDEFNDHIPEFLQLRRDQMK